MPHARAKHAGTLTALTPRLTAAFSDLCKELFPSLVSLSLEGHALPHSLLSRLPPATPRLTHLTLTSCTLSVQALAHAVTHLPLLESLDLGGVIAAEAHMDHTDHTTALTARLSPPSLLAAAKCREKTVPRLHTGVRACVCVCARARAHTH